MADILPREILAAIGTHLPQEDLYTCVRACRLWYAVLLPVLYSSVNIYSPDGYDVYIENLRRTATINPLGHFVRKIRILCLIRYDKLTLLPRLCPMVVEFDILEGWHEGISEISNEWKYLRKIPYVTIDTESLCSSLDSFQYQITRVTVLIKLCPRWINLMTELPNIEDLKLDFSTSSYRDDSLRIQLAELETLHNVLPRLEFLTIDHFYIGGPLPMHVKPHDRVRHLSISPEDGHMWDRYFSRKYTRLETLVFNDECYCSEDVKAGALTLARSCRHLKQFSAPAPSGNSSGLYKDVLEVLGQVGAPISCLVINKWDVLTYATIVQGLCRTITKIDYTMGERCIQEDMLKPLEACVRLEELMLLANDQVFELDSILDHCKNLKALKLSGRKICISENQRTGEGYGLRKLHMFAQVISDNVYPFVSHHCPHLSSIFDMEYEKRDVVGN